MEFAGTPVPCLSGSDGHVGGGEAGIEDLDGFSLQSSDGGVIEEGERDHCGELLLQGEEAGKKEGEEGEEGQDKDRGEAGHITPEKPTPGLRGTASTSTTLRSKNFLGQRSGGRDEQS